ncbi:hypothetical protein [Streptococcus dysgalactiae]
MQASYLKPMGAALSTGIVMMIAVLIHNLTGSIISVVGKTTMEIMEPF